MIAKLLPAVVLLSLCALLTATSALLPAYGMCFVVPLSRGPVVPSSVVRGLLSLRALLLGPVVRGLLS